MWYPTTYNTTKLTLELRDLINDGVKLWEFDYPSYYKGKEKEAFEQKVINHFYFRQIGQETVGRFLHMFRAKMNEIMPYYIQMYKSVEIMNAIDDPFGNVDIVESFEQITHGSSTDNASSKTNSKSSSSGSATENGKTVTKDVGSEDSSHKFSNTPQGSIDNLESYLTEASVDKNSHDNDVTVSNDSTNKSSGSVQSNDTSTQDRKSSNDETVKHTYTKKGNQGVNTYAHDMIEYRQSFIDVDMMIINALNELFLGVY